MSGSRLGGGFRKGSSLEPQFLKTLLRPYPTDDMACCRVSKLVNNAKHDSPDCLLPG